MSNDAELRAYLGRSLGTYWHPAGTCAMGSASDAVVDLDLRERGLAALRVADASVMPSVPGANLNATVLAIAERAADSSPVVPCRRLSRDAKMYDGCGWNYDV